MTARLAHSNPLVITVRPLAQPAIDPRALIQPFMPRGSIQPSFHVAHSTMKSVMDKPMRHVRARTMRFDSPL